MASAHGNRHSPSGTVDAVDPGERKERILHTRVPRSLDRHLKRRARNLGMSVSTVVRNVLLTTFGLVEDIVNDSTDIALAVTGHAMPSSRQRKQRQVVPATDTVLAWQEAVLNVNAVCQDCNAILAKGSRAALSVRDEPGPRAIICRNCLAKVEQRPEGPKSMKRIR